MTDTERLDWLQMTLRQQLGARTPERTVAVAVHVGADLRTVIDRCAAQWPDGRRSEEEKP